MKITPWKSVDEFEIIGESLLLTLHLPDPSLHDQIDHALHQVSIWRSKSIQGRLPHAIETTACLAEGLHKKDKGNFTTMEQRLYYSAAIIRGINGLSDASHRQMHQNLDRSMTEKSASSVASLCDRIGIPRWVVDIRHDASHSNLPSLSCLHLAAKTLLGYLGERYWCALRQSRNDLRESALKLIHLYEESEQKSPTKYAKEYTSTIPVDIGINVALDYFVKGIIHNRDPSNPSSTSSGVLLQTSPFMDYTKTYNTKIILKYLPLIKALQHKCPDFLSTILQTLVNSLLALPSNETILEWIHYFVSENCHSYLQNLPPPKESSIILSYDKLRKLYSLPLNSLCDICLEALHENMDQENNPKNEVIFKVISLFESILQSQRRPGHGLPNPILELSMQNYQTYKRALEIAQAEQSSDKKQKLESTNNEKLSLEDMEALISSSDSESDDNNMQSTRDKVTAISQNDCLQTNSNSGWKKCSSWDPCPIGTLPGSTCDFMHHKLNI